MSLLRRPQKRPRGRRRPSRRRHLNFVAVDFRFWRWRLLRFGGNTSSTDSFSSDCLIYALAALHPVYRPTTPDEENPNSIEIS